MRLFRILFILLVVQALLLQSVFAGETAIQKADQLLCAAIEQEFSLDTALTDIEVIRNPIPLDILSTQGVQHFESYNRAPRGLVSMTAYCVSATGERIPYGIQLRIRTFEDAFVTTVSLKQRSVLDSLTYERRRVETTLLADPLWSVQKGLTGVRAARSLAAGTVLTTRLIEPVPLIEVGGLVRIVIETPTVKITADGTALDAGRLGDRIRVRNQSSGKMLTAMIRSERDVVIAE